MTVKELIEKLKETPEDSEVGFSWHGNHAIGNIQSGKVPGQDKGYVLLHKKTTGVPKSLEHLAQLSPSCIY